MMPRDLWLGFKSTKVREIDDILAMVSHCAKIQRNTENWEDDGLSEMIQEVADKSARAMIEKRKEQR